MRGDGRMRRDGEDETSIINFINHFSIDKITTI
jgi:hypothetical protein